MSNASCYSGVHLTMFASESDIRVLSSYLDVSSKPTSPGFVGAFLLPADGFLIGCERALVLICRAYSFQGRV
jgi:hypothetical protein